MSKSRLPLYLGLGAAGVGGYYLYQSGGNVDSAKARAKADATKARNKLDTTTSSTTSSEELGERAGAKIDEILDTTSSKARQTNDRVGDGAKESLDRVDRLRQDTARSVGAKVDNWDRKVEEKASEAKKSVGGWFGK